MLVHRRLDDPYLENFENLLRTCRVHRQISSLCYRLFFLPGLRSMSQLIRKKTGAPDPKHYDSNEAVAKFDPVRQWLNKNCKKVN
jgi:hypothetical protein